LDGCRSLGLGRPDRFWRKRKSRSETAYYVRSVLIRPGKREDPGKGLPLPDAGEGKRECIRQLILPPVVLALHFQGGERKSRGSTEMGLIGATPGKGGKKREEKRDTDRTRWPLLLSLEKKKRGRRFHVREGKRGKGFAHDP